MSNDIPQWAKERACELANDECGRHAWFPDDCNQGYTTLTALARYIAKHEDPPVDPDLITAREICARVAGEVAAFTDEADKYRDGTYDSTTDVQFAIAKLKEARNA